MDIASLSTLSGIPQRKLRYVVDCGVVPGLVPAHHGRGNARQLSELEGVALLTAASFFQLGLSAQFIHGIFDGLGGLHGKILPQMLTRQRQLSVAGGTELLVRRKGAWYKLPEMTKEGRTPAVVVTADLLQLRADVRTLRR